MTTTIQTLRQGAYNAFYESEVRAWRLPARLNAKPYHARAPPDASDAALLHFQGPDPATYLAAALSEVCQYSSSPRPVCYYAAERPELTPTLILQDLQRLAAANSSFAAAQPPPPPRCPRAHVNSYGDLCALGLRARSCLFLKAWALHIQPRTARAAAVALLRAAAPRMANEAAHGGGGSARRGGGCEVGEEEAAALVEGAGSASGAAWLAAWGREDGAGEYDLPDYDKT